MLASEARQKKNPDAKNGNACPGAMSASRLTEQTCAAQNGMSALPPKADMCGATRYVRYGPIADMTTNMFTITNTMVERPFVQSMLWFLVEGPGNQRIDKIGPHKRRHVAAGGHFMHMPSGIRLGEQL